VFSVALSDVQTPARADLWGALMNAASVRWRVRAVHGGQGASPWSALEEQEPDRGGPSFLAEDQDFRALWALKNGGQEIFSLPRIAVLRSFVTPGSRRP